MNKQAPYRCIFCGAKSWRDPSDQEAPADHCSESDHSDFGAEEAEDYEAPTL